MERVFQLRERAQMKNIFSKNVFKKQFGIHIYSNYSPRDYRVSVMFRLRITRIFPRYSSAIPECSREGIEIQRRQGSLIASFYFYSFIDSFPNARKRVQKRNTNPRLSAPRVLFLSLQKRNSPPPVSQVYPP